MPKLPETTIRALTNVLALPALKKWMDRIAAGEGVAVGDLDLVLKVANAQALLALDEKSTVVRFRHEQKTPATLWSVSHNFGQDVVVEVLLEDVPEDDKTWRYYHRDMNTVVIGPFEKPRTGVVNVTPNREGWRIGSRT